KAISKSRNTVPSARVSSRSWRSEPGSPARPHIALDDRSFGGARDHQGLRRSARAPPARSGLVPGTRPGVAGAERVGKVDAPAPARGIAPPRARLDPLARPSFRSA